MGCGESVMRGCYKITAAALAAALAVSASACSRVRETDGTGAFPRRKQRALPNRFRNLLQPRRRNLPLRRPSRRQEEEPEYEPEFEKHIILGSDIHYLSPELTDYGEAFQYDVDHGDGRLVTYIDQITDAFLEEVVEQHPDILILSGDLSSNGELASHEGLAEKLRRVEAQGIPVAVIPGNHDINNKRAYGYRGR